MAIVLALVIVGWFVAFALGNQAGFVDTPETSEAAAKANGNANAAEPTATYREPASVS